MAKRLKAKRQNVIRMWFFIFSKLWSFLFLKVLENLNFLKKVTGDRQRRGMLKLAWAVG